MGAASQKSDRQLPSQTSRAKTWEEFHEKFMELADEEERIERANLKDRLMRAYCNYKEHPEVWAERGKPRQGAFCLLNAPETGLWMLSDGVSENFQARFRVLSARAGVTQDTGVEDASTGAE